MKKNLINRIYVILVTIGLSPLCYSQSEPLDSLVAHYSFDTNADDDTGNGYDGVIYGPAGPSSPAFQGNSLYFDTSAFVRIDNFITSYNEYTFNVWIAPTETSGPQPNTGIILQSYLNEFGDTISGYGIRKINDTICSIHAGANRILKSIVLSDPFVLHMVTSTWDGQVARLYLDGFLQDSVSVDTVYTMTQELLFAATNSPLGINNYYAGAIDEARIYNRALSDCEIRDLRFPENNIWPIDTLWYNSFGYPTSPVHYADEYTWVHCDNNYAPISWWNQSQTLIPEENGVYALILNFGACIDTTMCLIVDYVGLNELNNDEYRHVIQITDLLGRKSEDKPNTVLIYIYSDGTTEKVLRIE